MQERNALYREIVGLGLERELEVVMGDSNPCTTPPDLRPRPTLRYGSKGDHVKYLQRRLNCHRVKYVPPTLQAEVKFGNPTGLLEPLKVDGIFGLNTLKALTAFQTDRGLVDDGVVGKSTWSRLNDTKTGNSNSDFDEFWNFKLPKRKTVALSIFYSKSIDIVKAVGYNKALVDKAASILNEHNIGLDFLNFDHKPFVFNEDIYLKDQILDCRKIINQIYNDQVDDPKKIKRLPVIYVNSTKLPQCGQAILDSNWLPFIIIYANRQGDCPDNVDPDNVTLLHEIGHCALLGHSLRTVNSVKEDIMMTKEQGMDQKGGPMNRLHMNKVQVLKISKAYFCY